MLIIVIYEDVKELFVEMAAFIKMQYKVVDMVYTNVYTTK